MCRLYQVIRTRTRTRTRKILSCAHLELEYELSARPIFVSMATIRNNSSLPFAYRFSSINLRRWQTSKILAHSVAERFAIR